MIADIVVLASVTLTGAFITGWFVSPRLRDWIERPKHRFQDAVQQYDVVQHRHVMASEAAPRSVEDGRVHSASLAAVSSGPHSVRARRLVRPGKI